MPAKKNIKLGNSASGRQGVQFRNGEIDLSFRILFRGGKTVVTGVKLNNVAQSILTDGRE